MLIKLPYIFLKKIKNNKSAEFFFFFCLFNLIVFYLIFLKKILNILRPETLYNSIVTISEKMSKALQLNQHLLMHKVFGDLEGK